MKSKTIYILLLTIAMACNAFAQTYVIMVKPAGQNNWGYANLKGEMIIPAQFDKCHPFTEDGVTVVKEGGDWLFINIKGDRIRPTPKNFSPHLIGMGFGLLNFSDGLIPAKVRDGYGYFNTAGKLVIPMSYEDVTSFEKGFASVRNGKHFMILNKTGKENNITVPDVTDVRAFKDGLAPYETHDKFGFIDTNGKVVIQAQFQTVGYFYDDLAWAKDLSGKVGYINKKGEWVIKAQYNVGNEFDHESGMARIKKVDQWIFVSKSGEELIVKDCEHINDFSNGLAKGEKNKKIGFFNNKGEWVIAADFDDARPFNNGYAAVKQGEKWGVIDKTGKWVIEPKFDGIRDVELIK